MIVLNPDAVREQILEVVQAHFDDSSSPELMTDDLYKLFEEIITEAEEPDEEEDE